MEGDGVNRIALVVASSTGGTGRHVASLAQGLAEAGTRVTVFGPAAGEVRFGFTKVGADFAALEIPASPQLADLRAIRALRRALRPVPGERGFEVVHAHGLRAGLVAGLARPAGTPLVVTWHNLMLSGGLRGRIYQVLERLVARRADLTLCVSSDLVLRAERLGARGARLAAVPAPPLSPPSRDRAQVRAELLDGARGPLVLAVGRLHPQKGFDVLVSAATRWRGRDPAPRVFIAGAGPSEAELAAQIQASQAPVTLLGHRSDVADLLAAADVVVATSVWEGQPLLVQEVLRAGVPLVSTAAGGVSDIVGQAALLVPVGDVDAVDQAVARLLDDPRLGADYVRRGLAQAATWPSEADALAQVTGCYAELASGASR